MPDMVKVQFLQPSLPYLPMEMAWFTELQAAALIKQGFARRVADGAEYVPAKSRREQLEEQEELQHRGAGPA